VFLDALRNQFSVWNKEGYAEHNLSLTPSQRSIAGSRAMLPRDPTSAEFDKKVCCCIYYFHRHAHFVMARCFIAHGTQMGPLQHLPPSLQCSFTNCREFCILMDFHCCYTTPAHKRLIHVCRRLGSRCMTV
jgi:hypothetical protein